MFESYAEGRIIKTFTGRRFPRTGKAIDINEFIVSGADLASERRQIFVQEGVLDERLFPTFVMREIDRHQPTALRAAGKSFHSLPSRSRPPLFGRIPPHCLKKKETS